MKRHLAARLLVLPLGVFPNVRGAFAKTLYDGHRKPSRYEVRWNGQNRRGEPVSSGVYFYRMKTPGFVETRKMVLLR